MSVPATSSSRVHSPVCEADVSFSTVKVTSPSLIQRVHSIVALWPQKAEDKLLASQMAELHPLMNRLVSLKAMAESITSRLSEMDRNSLRTLYAVVDQSKKIQGVALALFSRAFPSRISCLATHPDNVPVPGLERQYMRGAGTALVRHISRDMLSQESRSKVLVLVPTESAIPFYEKIGFLRESDSFMNMKLTQDRAERLVHEDGSARHQMLTDDSSLVGHEEDLH